MKTTYREALERLIKRSGYSCSICGRPVKTEQENIGDFEDRVANSAFADQLWSPQVIDGEINLLYREVWFEPVALGQPLTLYYLHCVYMGEPYGRCSHG